MLNVEKSVGKRHMGLTLQNREKTVAVRENTGNEKPSHRKGEGEAEGVSGPEWSPRGKREGCGQEYHR